MKTSEINKLRKYIKLGYRVDSQCRLVHQVAYKQAYGDYPKNHDIMHIDGDVRNNSPDNLMALPRKLANHVSAYYRATGKHLSHEEVLAYLNWFKANSGDARPLMELINEAKAYKAQLKLEAKMKQREDVVAGKSISYLYRSSQYAYRP